MPSLRDLGMTAKKAQSRLNPVKDLRGKGGGPTTCRATPTQISVRSASPVRPQCRRRDIELPYQDLNGRSGRIPPAFKVSTSAPVSMAAVAMNDISSPPGRLMVKEMGQRGSIKPTSALSRGRGSLEIVEKITG